MNKTGTFDINEIGAESGDQFTGTFVVKTLLTRSDRLRADERRRLLIGANQEGALVTLQEEAFILGQLQVRITQGPDWWSKSLFGQELYDGNVIAKIYDECTRIEREAREEIKLKAAASAEKLKEVAES